MEEFTNITSDTYVKSYWKYQSSAQSKHKKQATWKNFCIELLFYRIRIYRRGFAIVKVISLVKSEMNFLLSKKTKDTTNFTSSNRLRFALFFLYLLLPVFPYWPQTTTAMNGHLFVLLLSFKGCGWAKSHLILSQDCVFISFGSFYC